MNKEKNGNKAKTGVDGLYYKDIEVTCIVLAENTYEGILKNIAEISEDKDENGLDVTDRDSLPNNVNTVEYNIQQQDDDDFEALQLKYFDLALRKYISRVNDTDVTTRIPQVTVSNSGAISYSHSKEPVYVANSDLVTYTIRVYNEGSLSGYAEKIKDDIPAGLAFVPTNDTNIQYRWKMYYTSGNNLVETTDASLATVIKSDYLSQAQGVLQGQANQNEISAFDKTQMQTPQYKDVKVVFRVIEQSLPQNSNRIIVNSAQISDDSDYDEDSIPDVWNNGEDDQDKEYVYVKYFDLSLLKWVNRSIVKVDEQTTTRETGYNGLENPEPIVKVDLDKKKLKTTTVKFAYTIKITNEGEIPGYATEISDYIPSGLEFVAEDNPLWTKQSDVKVTTKALEQTLLNPGQSATVEIIFTWKNDAENIGLKTNIAEISQDYNSKGAEDIDSTPNNQVPQEDDQDLALVILSIKTGSGTIYITITFLSILIIGSGVYLIKRYVLR